VWLTFVAPRSIAHRGTGEEVLPIDITYADSAKVRTCGLKKQRAAGPGRSVAVSGKISLFLATNWQH